MLGTLQELRVFYREFRLTFHTTGAVLPSGRVLARALTRFVRHDADVTPQPRRILEVGPGTGAVTRHIVRALRTDDRLDLVELNDRFVQLLAHKLATDAELSSVASRVHLMHAAVQSLPESEPYDLIISGLPLNNFSPELVAEIAAKLRRLLRRDGTLSFFQYIGIRRAKAAIGRKDRQRLQEIGRLLATLLREYEVERDRVFLNVPPAWVHHVRFM